MIKKWKNTELEECSLCGGQIQVYTSHADDNFFYDGDDCRCVDCHAVGSVSADEHYVKFDMEDSGDINARHMELTK